MQEIEVGSKWNMGATEYYAQINPQVGHWQAFTAINADGGICGRGYPPRPDRMNPIGSYVLRGDGCQECEDQDLYGAPRHIRM
eukprot:4478531-Pleurochrysis_carterae.AAC.2